MKCIRNQSIPFSIKLTLCSFILFLNFTIDAQPDLLNVMPNGNVGIGISTPQYPLDISALQSVMRMVSTSSSNGSVIELKNTTASPTFLGAINFNNGAGTFPGQIGYSGTNALTFRTNGSEKFRITAAGDVGLGTSAPSHKLHVIGSESSGAVGHFVNIHADGYGGYFKGGSIGAYGKVTPNVDSNHFYSGVKGSVDTEVDHIGIGFNVGVRGEAKYGEFNYGVYGIVTATIAASENIGVYGTATGTGSLYAGYFDGTTHVNGAFSATTKTFKIDHPLDPTNKNLLHSCVESPDMKNIYDGNVVTNAKGVAIVELPDYFESLNMEYRYQLTVIGQFAQAIINEEINKNQFSIKTDRPNVKVSWQVTGVRQDAFANAHRIQVEEEKPAHERGKYLHPEVFGMPRERSVHYHPEYEAEMKDRQLAQDKMLSQEKQRFVKNVKEDP